MADIPRISHDLNNTLEKCGLSPDGAKYVKMAIDPFHDAALDIVGLPDGFGNRSMVYDVKKNVTIATAMGAGNEWDCHINFTPMCFNSPHGADNLEGYIYDANGYLAANTGAGLTFGKDLIRICQAPTGTNTFVPDGATTTMATMGINDIIAGTDSFFEGSYRIVGFAFEVHNTTANLSKQGAVTCYRNKIRSQTGMMPVADTPFSGVVQSTGVVVQGPPINVEQAKLMGGVTYAAKEGCLVPTPIDPSRAQPDKYWTRNVVVLANDLANPRAWAPGHLDDLDTFPGRTFVQDQLYQTGAYFTGLSDSTTLELTMRCFLEFFPSPRSPLFALARPTPHDDPLVDRCMAEIASAILPGYPVSMNAKGDFFKAVLGAAKKVAKVSKQALGTAAMFSPRAAALNAALDNGLVSAKAVQQAVKPKKKK